MHVDEEALHRIVISESSKAYLTKEVDELVTKYKNELITKFQREKK